MRKTRQLSTVAKTALLISTVSLVACQGLLGESDTEGAGDGDSNPRSTGTGGGDAAGSGGATNLDDPRTCVTGIPATSQIPRLLNREYDATMKDLLGVTSVGGAAPSSLLVPDYLGSMTDIAWNSYLVAARQIAEEVLAGPNRAKFIACDPAVAGCLTDTISSFGRKAFRRPLNAEEVTSFSRLQTLTPAGTPDEVAKATLFAFLASPSFLLLPELSLTLEGEAVQLSQHEIATRLSFLLWGSVPDEVLSAAADAGELASKEQLLAQAERMLLARDKAAPLVTAFHRQYAHIVEGSRWGNRDHDGAAFPAYSPAAVEPMMAEIDAFFETVAFEQGTFADLFLSDTGYVNQDTAGLYGLDPAAYGPDLTRFEFPAGERPGFLTRAAFLSSYSGYAETSPILRGAYISERILGIEIQSPPAGATDKPVPPGNYTTHRQIIEALTTDSPCGGCHTPYINPPGFVLEHFDAVGNVQVTDPLGGAIDAAAEVHFTDDDVQLVTSPAGLMSGIAQTAEARRNYAQTWVAFATKRAPNSNDACIVEELSLKLSGDGYSILNLLVELTQADSFRLRAQEN